ncbi:LAMI_0H13388g1_1 [Lachancea mirantina]|uniref:LAMI_0H13388g1_1 n=1 Tax=Lachancea mirantina TaxID=1230905 RepID=A0A1G4KHQ1_9SACH|nr:LAMI_0H13388g1_1 [Lachancea mirantina]
MDGAALSGGLDGTVSGVTGALRELSLGELNRGEHHLRERGSGFTRKPTKPVSPKNGASRVLERHFPEGTETHPVSLQDSDLETETGSYAAEERPHEEQGVVPRLKNEIYHLRLELSQKEEDAARLQKLLNHSWSTKTQQQQTTTATRAVRHGAGDSFQDVPLLQNCDVLSHCSTSPYKGSKTPSSVKTSGSLATTTVDEANEERQVLKGAFMPFLQRTIDTLKASDVFEEDAHRIDKRFGKLKAAKCGTDGYLEALVQMLNEVTHLQRQCVALLNRELLIKRVSSQLEFLFTIFLDPEQYGLMKQEHVDELKSSMLDILVEVFDYDFDTGRPNVRPPLPEGELRKDDTRERGKPFYKIKKVKTLQKGLNICVGALQEYSTTKMMQRSKKPATTDATTRNKIQHPPPPATDASRLQTALEFIPIGFDEKMLQEGSPIRTKFSSEINQRIQLTPRALALREIPAENGDSLQQFFTEFLHETSSQDNSRSSIGSAGAKSSRRPRVVPQ